METSSLTPMMQQYCSIKEQYKDSLVFYRLGDFYELFYNDAKVASKELGLVLTKRANVPMCGVPWHASDMYITKLVKAGYRVAICEQTETPEEAKKRGGYKSTIAREITRVISNGTLIEHSMLNERSNNFLLAISSCIRDEISVAYADISTGNFFIEENVNEDLYSIITKISPSEILCPDSLLSKKHVLDSLDKYKSIIRAIPNAKFMRDTASERIAKFFGIKFIDTIGKLSKSSIEAVSYIVEYISDAYKSSNLNLSFPKIVNQFDHMYLDGFTRKSLELTITQNGEKTGSLLNTIDTTVTSQGARMLSRWLMEPLTSIKKINSRLDYVEFFTKSQEILSGLRKLLSDYPDIERSISRVLMNRAGPRDIKCILDSLKKSVHINEMIGYLPQLKPLNLTFDTIKTLVNKLDSALVDSPPMFARDGGFIRRGYDKELDEYIDVMENSEQIMHDLQREYIKQTAIPNLKIKSNSVIGYFIEISPNFASKVPYEFTHKQSLATCIRYTSDKLIALANKLYSADANAKRRELVIFKELINFVTAEKENIKTVSNNISFLDVVTSFAESAIKNSYVRPNLNEEKILNVKNGRHPVVEKSLQKNGAKFVANDINLTNSSSMSLLTGPNMGGKSTYLRQMAIIVIMAQIGSFVPAESADIGIVDRIFSRVGGGDDISSGKSTFMVEMIETATILRQATEKSFVVLDEIGRGTSTYDGLAIAWAVVEELVRKTKARTIFATHYHELKRLQDTLPEIQFLTVKVKECDSHIIFLHKIECGFADKSYGINVAALAGFPKNVLNRAEEILKTIS